MNEYQFKISLLQSIKEVCEYNLEESNTPTATGADAFRAILDHVETVLFIEGHEQYLLNDDIDPDID